MELPIIEVTGSKYEIGLQHGQKAKKQIAVNISGYKKMFMEYANISWNQAKALALTFEKNIKEYKAEYLEEIRGIAQGSGFEYEEILALNVRSELIFQGTQMTLDGCTSVAVKPELTLEHEIYMGQNWDWKVSMRKGIILLKIHQEGIPDIATITEAGMVGKIGCNSAGIGVCFNALGVDAFCQGIPIHIILRDILEQSLYSEAMTVVSKNIIGCPANIIVGHQCGEVIDFEVEAGDFDVLYPDEGILVHTNHFTSIKIPSNGHKDITRCGFPDTYIRYGVMKKLLNSKKGMIDLETLQNAFRHHTALDISICHHAECNGIHGGGIGTVFSIIMNLTRGEIYIAFGQPCQQEYYKYAL